MRQPKIDRIGGITLEGYEYLPVIEKALAGRERDTHYDEYVDQGLEIASRIVKDARDNPDKQQASVLTRIKSSLPYVPANVVRNAATRARHEGKVGSEKLRSISDDTESLSAVHDVREAIASLPPELREFMDLYVVHGNVCKVCAILHIHNRKGFERLEAAKTLLRETLKDYQ